MDEERDPAFDDALRAAAGRLMELSREAGLPDSVVMVYTFHDSEGVPRRAIDSVGDDHSVLGLVVWAEDYLRAIMLEDDEE